MNPPAWAEQLVKWHRMKLATFVSSNAKSAVGVVDTVHRRLLGLKEAARLSGDVASYFDDMLSLIDAGPRGLRHAQQLCEQWNADASIPLSQLKLLAPLPRPQQIRDCLVFEEHFANSLKRAAERNGRPPQVIPRIWYDQPVYYKANRFSVVGPDTDVVWPAYSDWMDFELELACVIGKTGKDISPSESLGHVFGFTIFNDFSARDAQYAEMEARLGPAKGKDFDTGNVLGPWIVTLDELGDPHDLKMTARVNGEEWGGGSSRNMHHKFDVILAHISKSETIYAGEVICSGTVGTGCGMELGRKLSSNDVIELEIEKIGVLRNRIVRQRDLATQFRSESRGDIAAPHTS